MNTQMDELLQPQISVIIPAYNCESTIRTAIESVIDQTFHQWELIIIDDGSNDATGKICDEYGRKDSRIVALHKENGGVSSARNFGLKKAIGDYVIFVDSDDSLFENSLEILMSCMEDCDLIIFGFESILKREIFCIDKEKTYDNFLQMGADYYELYKKRLINVPWNKFYKRSIIETHEICFPVDYSLGEDLIFNLFYFRSCKKIKIIKTVLYSYNDGNPNSLSRRSRINMIDVQRDLKLKTDECFGNERSVLQATSEEYSNFVMGEILNTLTNKDVEYAKKVKKLNDLIKDEVFVSSTKILGLKNLTNSLVIKVAVVTQNAHLVILTHKLKTILRRT